MDIPKRLAPHGTRPLGSRREIRVQPFLPVLAIACVTLWSSGPYALAVEPQKPWPQPPFQAWATPDAAWLRDAPKIPSKLAGMLHRGDVVTVTACQPDCNAPKAWAIVKGDGALPLKTLAPLPVPDDALKTSATARYIYGKVPHPKTPVFAKPSASSKVLRKEKAEFRLAFVPDPTQQALGWLQRPDGGWMRSKDVVLFTPSTFAGVRDPQPGPFVFVRRKVKLKQADKHAEPVILSRYQTLPLLGQKPGRVVIPGGWLPRSAVRIVNAYARPREVKAQERWIHVDLAEQVLTAYEGDKVVLATLVSTGKSGRKSTRTHEGSFKIYAKSVHTNMRGKPWDDYFAEGVPFAMHFDAGRALHGAYWHDQFGIEKSHGCINLAPRDAEWLFGWVPPELPQGWTEVLPIAPRQPQLAVVIEKSGKLAPSSLAWSGPAHVARK